MNVLCIGDVCGSVGCNFLRERLPALKRQWNIDLVIVNGENSADGNGILPPSLERIYECGADVVTGGNHTFRRREIYTRLDEDDFLLRPANYPDGAPGKGITYVDFGYAVVAVINLIGVVYMEPMDCPFKAADKYVGEAKKNGAKIIIVDFHAEATAEKRALGFYLDGRVSALFGTHTHVQTNDACVLPDGTGYITDIGMTGPVNSVLGVKPALSIAKMKDKLPVRFELESGECMINGCIFEIDKASGKTISAKAVDIR